MKLPSIRLTYLLGLIAVVALMAAAYYLQYFKGLNPCPLCILQRCVFVLLGIVFLIGASGKFNKPFQIILSILVFLFACMGTALAARQVWLQHFPPSLGSDCAGSLEFMLQAFPFHEVLQKVFTGTPDCSHTDWELWNISLAGWSCLCFLGFIVMSFYQFWRSFSIMKK